MRRKDRFGDPLPAGKPLFRRQRIQHLLLLLGCQLPEVFFDVLAIEVLHRERHGKTLPAKPLE